MTSSCSFPSGSIRKKKRLRRTSATPRARFDALLASAGGWPAPVPAAPAGLYGQLTRNGLSWFVDDDTEYWNELSNRLTRYLEELEMVRERINLVLESEHRRLSERMNRTMYLLAIITGFFCRSAFSPGCSESTSGYPGADFPYGFAVACVLIGSIALLQWWMLRRLRWL